MTDPTLPISSRLADIRDEIVTLEIEAAALRFDVSQLRSMVTARDTEIDEREATEAELRSRIVTLEARIAELETLLNPPGPGPDPDPPVPTPPSTPLRSIPLLIKETAGIERIGEVATSGVPFPRGLVSDPKDVTVHANDTDTAIHVISQIDPIGWWSDGSIQWALVSVRADVPANGEARYVLRVWESGKAPKAPLPPQDVDPTLRLQWTGPEYLSIATGAATFHLTPRTLLSGARNSQDKLLITDSKGTVSRGLPSASSTAPPVDSTAGTVRRFSVEREGPLVCTVIAEIESGTRIGSSPSGSLTTLHRYTFTAGSPTVRVRKVLTWEGSHSSRNWKYDSGRKVNAELFGGFEDTLRLSLGTLEGTLSIAEKGVSYSSPAYLSVLLEQQLRAKRTDPKRWSLSIDGALTSTSERATGGLVAARGSDGTIAIALRHMDRFEPQALEYGPGLLDSPASGRSLTIHWASDKFWLAYRQGCFADGAISALPSTASPIDLQREVWAPLNAPLLPMAPPSHYRDCAVPDACIPSLPLVDLARYDQVIRSTLDRTLAQCAREGIDGFMTTGLYPRYWGKYAQTAELSGANDPTPADDWDDVYLTATWADYHNTSATAYIAALRAQSPYWINELGTFASLRMLHTLIHQAGPLPSDRYDFAGQAPSGYGGYRSDFNSSHAYFEGLYLYYWLTGDSEVLRLLSQGAAIQKERIQAGKGGVVGRIGSQWMGVFRFLSAADPEGGWEDFLDECIDTILSDHILYFTKDEHYCAVLVKEKLAPTIAAGTYHTSNLWTQCFYDFENLARFDHGRDTLLRLARTYIYLAPQTAGGDGTIAGKWPRSLAITIDVAGKLVKIENYGDENDQMKVPNLYSTDKPAMAAFFARAALLAPDEPLIRTRAVELVEAALSMAEGEAVPLGKLSGLMLHRLHTAVALLWGGSE